MAKYLHIRIVTPEKVIISDKYISATVPSTTGELTILPGHIPLVALIKSGGIILKTETGADTCLAVSSGILEVRPDFSMVILANSAERAEDIELERAEKAKERIEQLIKEKKDNADMDYAMLQSTLSKEMARIKIARRHSKNKNLYSPK